MMVRVKEIKKKANMMKLLEQMEGDFSNLKFNPALNKTITGLVDGLEDKYLSAVSDQQKDTNKRIDHLEAQVDYLIEANGKLFNLLEKTHENQENVIELNAWVNKTTPANFHDFLSKTTTFLSHSAAFNIYSEEKLEALNKRQELQKKYMVENFELYDERLDGLQEHLSSHIQIATEFLLKFFLGTLDEFKNKNLDVLLTGNKQAMTLIENNLSDLVSKMENLVKNELATSVDLNLVKSIFNEMVCQHKTELELEKLAFVTKMESLINRHTEVTEKTLAQAKENSTTIIKEHSANLERMSSLTCDLTKEFKKNSVGLRILELKFEQNQKSGTFKEEDSSESAYLPS